MTISIIIPVFNAESTIERCLASILYQSHKDFELIIIDDGSTDNSLLLCKKILSEDKRAIIVHQENRGVSAARNAGIRIAQGDWITFIDADDYIESNYLETFIARSEDSDFLHANILTHSGDQIAANSPITTTHYDCPTLIRDIFPDFNLFYLGAPWGKLFKKEIITRNKILFQEGISFGEDSRFVYQYLQFVKNVAIAYETTYHYNAGNSGSLTNKANSLQILDKYEADYQIAKNICKALDIIAYNLELYYLNGVLEALAKSHQDNKLKNRIPYYKLIYHSTHANLVRNQLPRYFFILGFMGLWKIYDKIISLHYR